MIRCISFVLVGAALALATVPVSAGAQATAQRQQSVRFLLASNGAPPVALDVGRSPVLRQRLTLDLQGVTVREALTTISDRARLVLWYTDDVIAADRRVNLRADEITVAAALADVLVDAGVDVVFNRDGSAVIVKRLASVALVQVGAVAGHVTDSISREGVAGVTIAVEGTRLSTTTAADGGYTIRGVPAGNRSITARRLGFVRQSRAVTVADNQSVTVDFMLVRAPTTLTEVVTTATGDQRRVELGHVVGRINAEAVVKEAPISTLSELLTGRVAGVQVAQQQGTVGGQVTLQIRGRNSIQLNNQPIVIVDGVRYTTTTPPLRGGILAGEFTSPVNDINPNDIESVEVVKGPSAATLYGTDAANGVIVITTKRGHLGRPRWNAYAKTAQTFIPSQRYPDAYRAYGTTTSGAVTSSCQLIRVAAGTCTQDSIVVISNPLNNPELSIFGRQPVWETGINVSGGSEELRYYFSGGFLDATGPVQMPPAMVELLESNRGTSIPDEWRNPNTRNNLNLRSNVTAQFGSGRLNVHAGYVRDATQSFLATNPYTQVWAGTETSPYGSGRPEEYFAGQSTERADRFMGAATGQWQFMPWLQARGAIGLDVGWRTRFSLLRRGDAPGRGSFINNGTVNDGRTKQATTTADLGLSAVARHNRMSFRTSVGAQYVRNLTDGLSSGGFDLPPGASSAAQARTKTTSHSYTETVTLGGYLEEMVGLNDRLFLTGALRVDGASTFGQNYETTLYPKAGVSWLASAEPFFPRVPALEELRFRYAFGASGLQPLPAWSRPSYRVLQGWFDDTRQDAIRLSGLGNPDIRPERVREHEFGLDAAALDERLQLGVTWNRRRVVDQIALVPLAAGYGFLFTNLGLTTHRGFEAELTANLVNTSLISVDLRAQHASHRTKLVDLGDAFEARNPINGYAEGYSLGARFLPKITYSDPDGDGLLALGDVEVSLDEREYAGESVAPTSQSLTAVVGLNNRRVRVTTSLERRADFVQSNQYKTAQCGQLRCLATMDPNTPLEMQAMIITRFRYGGSTWQFLERGDFVRLRELSVAVDLPRFLGWHSATATLSGRNLGLWTSFNGADAESQIVGNDAFLSNAGAIPQARTWALRVDVSY